MAVVAEVRSVIDPVIRRESPYSEGVAGLISDLDSYQLGLYPEESTFLMPIDKLAASNVRFFVARSEHSAVGIGALVLEKPDDEPEYGELKRLFTTPEARGRGIARGIIRRVIREAKGAGMSKLRLETGDEQPEALALYESEGFRYMEEPFGIYPADDPHSVCMELVLARTVFGRVYNQLAVRSSELAGDVGDVSRFLGSSASGGSGSIG